MKLEDVADRAKVSIATVSRALNRTSFKALVTEQGDSLAQGREILNDTELVIRDSTGPAPKP